MANDWPMIAFGDLLIDGTRNGVYKPKKFHGTGCKIVNMGELFAHPRLRSVPMKRLELTNKELSKSALCPKDLLFARRSLVAEGAGKCSIVLDVDEPTTFESSIIRARVDPEAADPLFLYYFFNSPDGRYLLGTIRRQVAVAGITGSDLVTLEVPNPSLPVQGRIAEVLGKLDDRIELTRRIDRTLEKMAAAIFKSWFIDFDPVHAKAEGRDPSLPADIADLFPDAFEDSDLGPIPKGWDVKPLDEIADYLNGLACQKHPPVEGQKSLPVIKIRELRQGITNNTDRASVDVPAKYIVEDGDVLFSWSGSLLVTIWCGGRGVLNQHVFKVTSTSFPKWFFYQATKHHLDEFQRIASGKATTMGHIKRHHLTDAKMAIPDEKLMAKGTEVLGTKLDRRINALKQARILALTRDALLPKLLSGEIELPEAEAIAEEVGT